VSKKIDAGTVLSKLTIGECLDEEGVLEGEEGGALKGARVGGSGADCYEHLSKLTQGIDGSVTEEQKRQLVEILQRYSDVFSKGELDLEEMPLAKHRIDTGDARPLRQTLRRQPFHLLEKIDEHVQDMLKAGVIEPSNSPWTSNIVVVKKKDDSLRYCVDYRRLNSVARRDAYPLPRIDSCLDALSGAHLFSTFDLRASYHQVPMHEDDADKTTFIVRTGTYRFKRIPFGLCNAGSSFQRVMDLALSGLNYNMCLVYLDDIIVYSSSVEEHIERLGLLFERSRAANLKLKPSKCPLLRTEVSFLGHVVSGDGISTDPEKKLKLLETGPCPGILRRLGPFWDLQVIIVNSYRRSQGSLRPFTHWRGSTKCLSGRRLVSEHLKN